MDNVAEYNKCVLEFLGYVNTTPTDKDFNIYEHPNGGIIVLGKQYKMIEANFEKRFAEDWNWIIEVILGVQCLGYRYYEHSDEEKTVVTFTDMEIVCQTHCFGGGNIVIQVESRKSRKDAVVLAIWNFLNWYNEHQKK